jgi:hypothetical protein
VGACLSYGQREKSGELHIASPTQPEAISAALIPKQSPPPQTAQRVHLLEFKKLLGADISKAIRYLQVPPGPTLDSVTLIECLHHLKTKDPTAAISLALKNLHGISGTLCALSIYVNNSPKVGHTLQEAKRNLLPWQFRLLLKRSLERWKWTSNDVAILNAIVSDDFHHPSIAAAYATAIRAFAPDHAHTLWNQLPIETQRYGTTFYGATPLAEIESSILRVKDLPDIQSRQSALSGLALAAGTAKSKQIVDFAFNNLEGAAYDDFFKTLLLNSNFISSNEKEKYISQGSENLRTFLTLGNTK